MVVNKSGNLPINVTFTASDATLNSHVWTINGTQESTSATFTKSFNAYGNYTVVHSGGNTCGSNCSPITETLSLTQTPLPPSLPIPIELVYLTLGIGAAGLVWMNLPYIVGKVSTIKKK